MSGGRLYEFGPFRLDTAKQQVLRNGESVPLTPKAVDTLTLLIEQHGKTVHKEEIFHKVWPGTFVEDSSLTQMIFMLRKALGSGGNSYIETVPKRGYLFAGPVVELPMPELEAAALRGDSPVGAHLKRNRRRGWIALATACIFLLAAFGAYTFIRRRPSPSVSRPAMIAVLPVENLTGDSSREYVSDGVTEEMIAQLGQVNPARLGVIARTSSMAYKKTTKTVGQIGGELGVDYVLESSIRGSADQMRFTAQLIRTADQTHVWAHSYERPLADVVTLQRDLARTVGEEVQVSLSPQATGRRSRNRPVNADAYDAYIQGRFHWNKRTAKELLSAVSYFQQAIAKDPEYAPAYAGLADSYAMLGTMRQSAPQELMPKAKDALIKALALDDSLADVHTSLGWVMEVFDWDWKGSEKEFNRAIELDGNNANAHHRYAIHLAAMGRFPEALAQMRHAQRLDPLSPVIMTSTAWVLLRSRLPDAAIPECRKALDLDPNFVRGHLCLGEAYEQKRDLPRAAAEFFQGKALAGDDPAVLAVLKDAMEKEGYYGYFRTRLAQLQERSKGSYVSPFDFADLNIRLGNKDEALKWLEQSYQERSPYLVNLQIEPRMDFLRSDPRFQDLVRRLGLSDVHVIPIDSQTLNAKLP